MQDFGLVLWSPSKSVSGLLLLLLLLLFLEFRKSLVKIHSLSTTRILYTIVARVKERARAPCLAGFASLMPHGLLRPHPRLRTSQEMRGAKRATVRHVKVKTGLLFWLAALAAGAKSCLIRGAKVAIVRQNWECGQEFLAALPGFPPEMFFWP